MPLPSFVGRGARKAARVLNTERSPSGVPGRIVIVAASTQLPPTSIQLASGGTFDLDPLVYDSGDDSLMVGQTVTWTSLDTGIVTVNGSGVVSYVANGTTIVQASVNSGGGNPVTAVVAVTTTGAAAVASVSQSLSSMSGVAGTSNTFTVQPKDAGGNNLSGRTVTALSSDTGVATVSVSGYTITVNFIAAGTCTVTPTCETISGAGVAVTAVASSGAYPNRAADITTLQAYADNESDQMDTLTTNSILSPTGWTGFTRKQKGSASNFFGQSDPGSPNSHTKSLRTKWTSGIVSTGTVTWDLWPGGLTSANRRRLSKVYFSMQFKFVGSDFENNQSGVKLIYLGHGQNPATSSLNSIIMIRQGGTHSDGGSGSGTGLYSALKLHWYRNNFAAGTQQFTSDTTGTTGVERVLNTNVNSNNLITVGSWHQMEVELRVNSAVGVGDGIIKIWIDGVLCMSYSNIFFKTTGNTENFTGWTFDNTWGGGGAARTRTDNLDIAEVAIYGEV